MRMMAAILHRERQHHQATVDGLRTILDQERTECNIFLKDMKKMLDDMEQYWPNQPFHSSTNHIQQTHVSRLHNILQRPISYNRKFRY